MLLQLLRGIPGQADDVVVQGELAPPQLIDRGGDSVPPAGDAGESLASAVEGVSCATGPETLDSSEIQAGAKLAAPGSGEGGKDRVHERLLNYANLYR